MSDLAIFAIGMGIGLLVVMPVIYVLRHEIAANARKLFGSSAIEGVSGGQMGSDVGARDDGRPDGISPLAATISVGAAALSLLWGIVSSNVFFIVPGAVIAIAVLLAFTANRKRGS